VQAAAVKLVDREYQQQQTERDPAAEASAWQITIDAYVAGFPREALDPGNDPETGEWKPISIDSVEDIDQRDRAMLEMLILRLRTAEDITASVERGDYDVEAPGELDSLAEFRDDGRGIPDSDDSEDVGPAPILAAAGEG